MKNRGSKKRISNWWVAGGIIAALIVVFSLMFSLVGNAQITPDQTGNFEVDGNLTVDNPGTYEDWGIGTGGTGAVITGSGPDWSGGPGILIQDPNSQKLVDNSVFIIDGKMGDTSTWTIGPGEVPAQNELTNVYVYPLMPQDSPDGHAYMIMGFERTKSVGTFTIGFEINQIPWILNYVAGKSAPGPTRTAGDIWVGFDLPASPTTPTDFTAAIMTWNPSGDPINKCLIIPGTGSAPDTVLTGTDLCPNFGKTYWVERYLGPAGGMTEVGFATVNFGNITAGAWGSTDEAGANRTSIPAFEFGEAAIDMTAMGLFVGCPGFGSVFAQSLASLSSTSDMKDLAGPVSLGMQCSLCGHKYYDSDMSGGLTGGDSPLGNWTIHLAGTLSGGGSVSLDTLTGADGSYCFTNLYDGNYTITEGDAPESPDPTSGWDWVHSSPDSIGPIEIDVNNPTSSDNDFFNYATGCLEITKAIDMGTMIGALADVPDATFTISVTGPSYPSGTNVVFDLVAGVLSGPDDGNTTCLCDLIPGNYTVAEEAPTGWETAVISPSQPVEVLPGTACGVDAIEVIVTNTPTPGCLEITKAIDMKDMVGLLADVEDTSFTITVSGPSYSTPEELVFDLIDGVLYFDSTPGNTTCLCDLIPGNYTVAEVAPAGWETADISPAQPVTVVAGTECDDDAVVVIVTNTPTPGCLKVEKVVDLDDVINPEAISETFQICIQGPSYPSSGNCQNIGIAGGNLTWENLIPGNYTISETNPGPEWDVDISPTKVDVAPGDTCDTVRATVTNTYVPGKIIVEKVTCPEGSEQSFEFDPSYGNNFFLTDGGNNTSGWLAVGTYNVAELNVPQCWELTGIAIDDPTTDSSFNLGAGNATIVLAAAETVKVTFTDTEWGHVVVEKTENGAPPTSTFYFELSGPGIGTITGNTTAGNTTVDFGGVCLQPGTYTLCERYVQAGWTFGTDGNWTMNKSSGGGNQIVTPTLADPDEARYCYTFQVACGETVTFYIDNVTPGGCPRTPGYWKNWNLCKLLEPNQHNRYEMALANDFWLMEDFLSMQIGDLNITDCTTGIKVLNSDDQTQSKKDVPVNRSSDAAYKLARNLFAAKLNLAAGACTANIQTVVDAAQALLVNISWTGTGSYLPPGGKPSADRDLANSLAGQLDQYNNGVFCGCQG